MNRTRTRLDDESVANGPKRKRGGRDRAGKFSKGNRFGVGHGRPRDELRTAALQAVTPENVAAIMQRAVLQAKAGSEKARRFIIETLIGKPRTADAPPITIDGMPAVENLQSAIAAVGWLTGKVAAGEINATEAQRVAAVLGELRRVAGILEDPDGWGTTPASAEDLDFSYM